MPAPVPIEAREVRLHDDEARIEVCSGPRLRRKGHCPR